MNSDRIVSSFIFLPWRHDALLYKMCSSYRRSKQIYIKPISGLLPCNYNTQNHLFSISCIKWLFLPFGSVSLTNIFLSLCVFQHNRSAWCLIFSFLVIIINKLQTQLSYRFMTLRSDLWIFFLKILGFLWLNYLVT